MQTNLIQNYIHNAQQPQPQKPPVKKEVPNFDIHYELANKTFIKPLKGEGRLVKANILDAPKAMYNGIKYDFKALSDAIDGDANDHQLGKLNDLGMKFGGLAIASYLFTKRQPPLNKAMEFVGLGSFFASMAIWPKLAIQFPARLIHGFNVQQQYEDSFGRKKPFYQDPQFLPWDLYTADQINKIGDRMGVPKNIKNRRDFIQEKMKKIAIQNNTLWMLTAGFATPIMSALICNQLEGPISNGIFKIRNKNNNNILNNFSDITNNHPNKNIERNIANFITLNQNKPLTDKLLDELSILITDDMSPEIAKALKEDLKVQLKANTYTITPNSVRLIAKDSRKALMGLNIPEEVIDSILPKPDALLQHFDKDKKYLNQEFTYEKVYEIFQEYTKEIRENLETYKQSHTLSPRIESKIKKKFLLQNQATNPIFKHLTQENFAILDVSKQAVIKSVAHAFTRLTTNLSVFDKYLLNQFGQIQETTIGDYWNNTIKGLFKTLNITTPELEAMRGDRTLAASALRSHYEDVAADKTRYKNFVNFLVGKISELNTLIKKSDVDDEFFNPKEQTKFDKLVNTTFKNFEADIKAVPNFVEGDMEDVLNEVLGCRPNINGQRAKRGALKEFYKNTPKDRLIEIKSSLFRILNSMDTYRRIAQGDPNYLLALHKDMPREVKEEIVELSKLLGVSGHTSDFFVKFFQQVNPNPNLDDKSNIEIKNGKPVYKYFREGQRQGKVTLPQDYQRFIETIKLQYENNMLQETVDAFGKNKDLLQEFHTYRQKACSEMGNLNFIENVFSKHNRDIGTSVSDSMIFRLVGAPSDEVLSNFSKQHHNTYKWLKTFGTMGAVLLGVTVASQFFFGRMKPPKEIETEKGNTYA